MNKPADMNVGAPRFTLADVAKATDVPVNTIRTWIQRGLLPIGHDGKANEGDGLPRYVTGRFAFAVAIAGALKKQGVSAATALEAGLKFSFSGDFQNRLPGFLFTDPDNRTMTMIGVSGKTVRVFAVRHTDSVLDVMKPFLDKDGKFRVETILRVDWLVRRTAVRLGLGLSGLIGQHL